MSACRVNHQRAGVGQCLPAWHACKSTTQMGSCTPLLQDAMLTNTEDYVRVGSCLLTDCTAACPHHVRSQLSHPNCASIAAAHALPSTAFGCHHLSGRQKAHGHSKHHPDPGAGGPLLHFRLLLGERGWRHGLRSGQGHAVPLLRARPTARTALNHRRVRESRASRSCHRRLPATHPRSCTNCALSCGGRSRSRAAWPSCCEQPGSDVADCMAGGEERGKHSLLESLCGSLLRIDCLLPPACPQVPAATRNGC